MNAFGRIFRVHIFGESHGESAGINIDGCPAGLPLSAEDFLEDIERRKGGTQKGTTPRKEDDIPIFKSGVFNGRTTGAPITILFENKNTRSGDYEKQRAVPRPGHADFVAHAKFGGYEDFRGGGHFSGRLTVCLVAAGVIAKKLLAMADLSPGPSPKERGASKASEFGYHTNTEDQWISVSNYAKQNRKEPTEAENILWQELRNRNLKGFEFRRQHAIAGFIPDFVCLDRKLMVEIDGGYHNEPEQQKYDSARTEWLNEHGYRMVRVTNEEVLKQLPLVLIKLEQALSVAPESGQANEALSKGEGLGEVTGIKVNATILEIGGEKDLEKGLQKAIDQKDSIGGIVECRASGLPVGLGEPFFDSVESVISHAVFAIPAIRGIEFGTGFAAARMFGVDHNDTIEDTTGKTTTNHAGGVVGGISNGNELVFRIAVKPTSSTPKEQHTLNWETGAIESFSVKGRHDLCIALRVPVVLEAVTALVLVDLLMLEHHIKRIL